MKRTVIGFVGPNALTVSMTGSGLTPALKALRNYLEDRIENEFDAFANLAIADEGTLHVRFVEDHDPEQNAILLRYAEECARAFEAVG